MRLLDITEVLTMKLCLEQITSLTVLHLDTLNKRLISFLGDESLNQDVEVGLRKLEHVFEERVCPGYRGGSLGRV